MVESGFIIYKDGTIDFFGKHVCTDEPNYVDDPTHEKSFINEIVNSMNFKFYELSYDTTNSFYQNALELSLDGEIIIINNRLTTTSKEEIMGYVPQEPTEEQLESLDSEELKEKLAKIKIQRLYEFQSLDFNDYLEYENLEEYKASKNISKN